MCNVNVVNRINNVVFALQFFIEEIGGGFGHPLAMPLLHGNVKLYRGQSDEIVCQFATATVL